MKSLGSFVFALFCLLYVASWPGAALRPLVVELAAAPIPAHVHQRDGVLDVVVRAKDSGTPIEGARVRALAMIDGRAHAAGTAVSDVDGRATLRDLPQAEHWVVAEAPGRARASQMVVVVSGARRLELALGVEHTLDVEVRTEGGSPIAKAEIEVRGTDPFPVGARTNDTGRVHVARLGDAPYTVIVRAPGYEAVTRRRVPEGAPVVVTLSKQGTLLVKVVGESGQPEAGARILVASPTLWPARTAEAGKEGSVRIGGLDSGTYSLRALHGARVSAIDVGVVVTKGEEKVVELRLGAGVMVVARVVDASNDEAVADARVTLAEAGLSPFPVEGVTDRGGRVVLGPIAAGSASLSARADGFVPKGAVRVEDPLPHEVKIPLLRGGALVGRVVDGRGFPIDGATIRVVGTDIEGMPIDEDPMRASFRDAHFAVALAGPSPLVPAGELGVMPGPVPPIPHGPATGLALAGKGSAAPEDPWVSRRDGTFRIKPVTPGRVRLLVRHPQYVEAMSEIVALAPEKEAQIDIVLQRGGSLEGRIVDARHRPVAGAHVTVLATRGSVERMTRTATDGTFAFASVPQDITVLVSREEDLLSTAARAEVHVPDGVTKTLELTLPDPREALPVRITADRGSPVDAAQVSAVSIDAADGLRVTAFTDRRGEAVLAGARGLPLRVEVRAPGRATQVVVTTPETTRLDVELASAESVIGELRANRREAIADADVVIYGETGTRRGRTNKDGAFSISDVPPGRARVRIRAKGRAPLERDLVVEDRGGKRATDLGRLELSEEGLVEGTVVDGKGDPIPGARVGKDAVPTYLSVGPTPAGMAITDAKGRFRLGELAEGTVVLEAYSPEAGRARVTGVRVVSGRTTDGIRMILARDAANAPDPLATGGVAITLGETFPGATGILVVVVAVSEGSEAERAGIAPNDVILDVGGGRVATIAEARARLSGPIHDDVVVKVRRGEREMTLRIPREQVRR